MVRSFSVPRWQWCAAGSRAACALPPEGGQSEAGAQSATEGISPADPKLTLSPAELLRKFEPAANEEYTLGPGDEISIQFPGRPEMATKDVIGPDGRITLPFKGPIEIANLTREAGRGKNHRIHVGLLQQNLGNGAGG